MLRYENRQFGQLDCSGFVSFVWKLCFGVPFNGLSPIPLDGVIITWKIIFDCSFLVFQNKENSLSASEMGDDEQKLYLREFENLQLFRRF